jgi:RNA polymerase sigma-70 factor (ECF subfamily)
MSNDVELLARIARGDEAALRTLYASLYAPLWKFAFALTRSRDDAEDIVQDVFVRFWERRENVVVRESLTKYFYRAVRNRAADVARHGRVVANASLAVTGETPLLPSRTVELGELSDALRVAITELPPARRAALTLRYVELMSHDDIADVLGVSPQAVMVHLSRARDTLRQLAKRYLAD